MIDPHVHCRDWAQGHKETIAHALHVAEYAGISAIFDMPNTDPPIISRDLVRKRLDDANRAGSSVRYGLYVGMTANPRQIKEAVAIYREFFPRVVGFKLYAGHSVGTLAVPDEPGQRTVYETLSDIGYNGMLAVHCEKEQYMKPELWSPKNPSSHTLARPPEAEIRSIEDQIAFAAQSKFSGVLHIAHISHPDSVEIVCRERTKQSFRISCGVTPHHCLLSSEMMQQDNGILMKVNPPLRSSDNAVSMLDALRSGKIDCVETDHAPHTIFEKVNPPYMSGFPGLSFVPHFLRYLALRGFTQKEIDRCTHWRACELFKVDIPNDKKYQDYDLATEYQVDVYERIRKKLQNEITL